MLYLKGCFHITIKGLGLKKLEIKMSTFGGPVLFLDRSDINTDEIIPAGCLSLPKQELIPHLFENLKIDGFNPANDIAGKKVVIARENFGCGAEHDKAPLALSANGITTVVSSSFAKNFRKNMQADKLMAIEIDKKSLADMFKMFADKDTECKVVLNDDGTAKVKLIAGSLSKSYQFSADDTQKSMLSES